MFELGYLKETINGDDTMGEVIELGTIYGEYFENLLMKQRKSESRDYVVSAFQYELDELERESDEEDDCYHTFREAGDYDTAWEDTLEKVEHSVERWLRDFAHRHGFVEDVTPNEKRFMTSYKGTWGRDGKIWCFNWPDMNEVIE